MSTGNLNKAIEARIKQHAGLRAAARALQIDAAYLCRVKHGEKGPSDKLLRKLGLRRVVTFEFTNGYERAAVSLQQGRKRGLRRE